MFTFFPMDLERGRSLSRRNLSYSPARRALGLTGDLLLNAGARVAPFIASAFNRGSSATRGTPPTPPRSPGQMPRTYKRRRGRSMSRSTSRSRSRSRGYASRGVMSRQHDQSTRFRVGRRRPTRRVRRFVRRVQNIINSDAPLQTYTVKSTANGTSNVNEVGFYGVGLYTDDTTFPDLTQIFTDAYGASPVLNPNVSGRVYLKNAVLDVEVKNTGAAEMIMDVYELVLRKDTSSSADISSQFGTLFGAQQTITSKSAADVSNTVFENPVFCQHFKVLKKREVLILPSEIITMQMRLSKDRLLEADTINEVRSGIPKLTRYFFLMWHGPPDPTAGAGGTPAIAATTMTVSWQKSYKYALAPNPRQVAEIHNG